MDTFILGLQCYRAQFESNVIGFDHGPSEQLMWHCLDVGCEPTYDVTPDRLPEPKSKTPNPTLQDDRGGM